MASRGSWTVSTLPLQRIASAASTSGASARSSGGRVENHLIGQRGKPSDHSPPILVRQDPQHEDQSPVLESAQGPLERRGAGRVVGSVQNDRGALRHDLQPPFPAHGRKTFPDGLVADLKTPAAQDPQGPQGACGVFPLVGPLQCQGQVSFPSIPGERKSNRTRLSWPEAGSPGPPAAVSPSSAGKRFPERLKRGPAWPP